MFQPKGGEKRLVGQGYPCHLPPIPDKHLIIGYNKPREEQYWQRLQYPANYQERLFEEERARAEEAKLVTIGKRKTVTHVDPVLERFRRYHWYCRLHGLWFMNDGEPTYLTNHHFWYLQWCKFDHPENDGYPYYYEFSRDNFYVRQWCEGNPRSLGYLMVASRGTGKSNEEVACVTNRATYFHNHRAAYQGNHIDASRDVLLQAKTVPLFNNLPSFFKPQFSHGTAAKNELVFTRPSVSGKASRDVQFDPDLELNSTIYAVQPGEKVLDKDTCRDVLVTEIGKCNKNLIANAHTRHGKTLRAVWRNNRKIGIMREETTVEEMDDGGDECHQIYKESDFRLLDGNGWTKSKIHRHFISALDTNTSLDKFTSNGKEYPPPCNKYGKVDRKLAGIIIQNDLDSVKSDIKELSSRMRKSPRNESEAFIKDQSKSIFNVMLLTNRLEKIRNGMTKKPYIKGNFYWVGKKFDKVWWKRDDHAGRFNCAWLPDEFVNIKEPGKEQIINNFTKEWDYDRRGKYRQLIKPGNTHLFRLGTDPIKFVRTSDPRASKAAIHAFRSYDHLVDGGKPREQWKSHNFFLEYCQRPEDTEIYCEDLAMACIFLGAQVFPERNVPTVNEYFETNGLENLLAYQAKFVQGETGLNVQAQSDEAGLASTPEVIDYYTKRIIPFINKDIDRMPFDDTIEDWLDFDSLKPTKSHLTVSAGFTLVHNEKVVHEQSQAAEKLSDWFDTFENEGVTGNFINQD